jgi:hypothetical protein
MNQFVVCGLQGGANGGAATFPVLSSEPPLDTNLDVHALLNLTAPQTGVK